MTHAEELEAQIVSLASSEPFAEAWVMLRDGSRLYFRHSVGERTAQAVGRAGDEKNHAQAGVLLAAIQMFRLNKKHLDITFTDGSRWERKP